MYARRDGWLARAWGSVAGECEGVVSDQVVG